ncbi:unnamed protein product, partial [marine sediment metagenome]
MTKEHRELIQEAKDFMISETLKHPKTWKGLTTEEWMVAFTNEKIEQSIAVAAEEIRKRELRKSK